MVLSLRGRFGLLDLCHCFGGLDSFDFICNMAFVKLSPIHWSADFILLKVFLVDYFALGSLIFGLFCGETRPEGETTDRLAVIILCMSAPRVFLWENASFGGRFEFSL